ncbi:MAG: hypothetical protein ABJK43_06385 [Lentilitoribacter sp.]
MSIEILIAVTDGCRRITEYKHHSDLPFSAVFERGNPAPLRETKEFDSLIGKLGDLYAEKLSSGKNYRLSIDRKIGHGDSWRFPAALNHIIQDTEYAERAQRMSEELVIWSTGSLEHDLRIDASKFYEVELKLNNSEELLTSFVEEAKKVLVLIPEHESEILESDVVKKLKNVGVEFFVVSTIRDALDIISQKMDVTGVLDHGQIKDVTPSQLISAQRKPIGKVVPVLAIFALIAGGGALYATVNSDTLGMPDSQEISPPIKPKVDESKPKVEDLPPKPIDLEPKPIATPQLLTGFQMKRLEGSDEASCIKLVMQPEVAITQLLTADDRDVYEVVLKPEVCGLQLINTNSESLLTIDLPDTLVSQTLSSKSAKAPTPLAPNETLNLYFKKNKPQVGDYVVSVVGAGNKTIKIRFVGG